MTATAARTVANLVLVSAAAAAAYVIITTPPLRRLAGTAIRVWLGTSGAAYLAREVGRAWAESARRAPELARGPEIMSP
jgi:hypothetical protein